MLCYLPSTKQLIENTGNYLLNMNQLRAKYMPQELVENKTYISFSKAESWTVLGGQNTTLNEKPLLYVWRMCR